MCKDLIAAAAMAWPMALPDAAAAHFQLAFSPQTQIERAGDVALKLIFWHPFENGPVMDMAPPQAVWALHRGARIDLSASLVPITFSGAMNAGAAYDATLPVRRAGDYVIVVEPAPYYEASEDKFIQQFTKAYLNRAGLPTDWQADLGLPAEIVPLAKPYNLIAGSSFTGRVMAGGQPVPGAEIEVEFIAAEPDMAANRPGPVTAQPMPGGAVVIHADESGYFTYAIPRAGHWGFAALDIGPKKAHEGKPLSQDAVIWVRAYGMGD
jgi:cobalt/nickel transport protein